MPKQLRLDVDHEIIVDLFAGGGGLSTAVEQALGRSPDIAINHSDDALSMHRANHPQTRHFISDVWEVDPQGATRGRPVGLLHLSPDCRDFSQSKGGQPRSRTIRALSWVGYRWAAQVRPRIITLENVKEILRWGPLVAKRDPETGRVVTLDTVKCPNTGKTLHRVAAPGEQVPVHRQYLVPDKRRLGQTWRKFVRSLERLGYEVQWRCLVAADFGAPTTRERLFMVARCDGQPIVWPHATHHKIPERGQRRWRSASECIDWSVSCRSIFGRDKPLADNTLRRIAKGIQRYVLDSADPFIVPIAHYNGSEPAHDIREPLRTVTAQPKGGSFALCAPCIVLVTHQGSDRFHPVREPLRTVTGAHRGELAVTAAYLAQMNGGFNKTPGHGLLRPMTTVTNSGSQQQLVTAHLAHLRGNCDSRNLDDPLMTVSAGGQHHALVTAFLSRQFGASIGHGCDEPNATITAGGGGKSVLVECALSPAQQEGAIRVAAFLMKYHASGSQWSGLRDPMHTITAMEGMALVTVTIRGVAYVIVDIGLRMLTPRELYLAQGFPSCYIIDRGHDGRAFSKSIQVQMCGNSVSPPVAAALLAANCGDLSILPQSQPRKAFIA